MEGTGSVLLMDRRGTVRGNLVQWEELGITPSQFHSFFPLVACLEFKWQFDVFSAISVGVKAVN